MNPKSASIKPRNQWLIFLALVGWGLQHSGADTASEESSRVTIREGIEYARPGKNPLLLDLYLPKDVENPPLVVFIHGGGWKGGKRKPCRLAWVAHHGYAVASIDYRFSQEAIFPAQIEDCKTAVRWLRAHAKQYGYNAARIVVAGGSAGGHLAALMGTSGDVKQLEGAGGHPEQSSRVDGVIDYCGPADFILRIKSEPHATEQAGGGVFHLLGGKASENLELARLASPVTHVSPDDPPMLIFHGAKDTKVLPEQSEVLRDRYREVGLDADLQIMPEKGHGFGKRTELEERKVLAFLRETLKPGE